MKKYLLIFITIIICSTAFAQEPADALRYSWITQNGTARNQAIGGASVSLGGEFSVLFTNPAGLGFYKTNEFVLSPAVSMQKNTNRYFNNDAETKKTNFNLGASGLLFSLANHDKNSSIKNVTVAFGVNQSANFNSRINYSGLNNKSSYSEKYLEELINNNVTDPNDAATKFPFGSSLALNTYLIDTTVVNGRPGYKTLANSAFGLLQENSINTSGHMTDISLGAAVNLKEKWFFGGSLSIPIINYLKESTYRETDASDVKTNNFDFFEVNEKLETKGYGINAKLGAIYKPVEYVRLGLAIQTPTYYSITETYSTEVRTDLEGYGGAGIKKQSSKDFFNGDDTKSKYDLISPWKVAISGSYVFREVENVKRQRAFITADIEYVNHKASGFRESDEAEAGTGSYFDDLNDAIDDEYKGAFNFKLGGELKFNTIMFRLGGAYYGNPYKYEKANKINLGGGLGYRDKGVFVDLTYVHSMNKDVNYPYTLQDNPGYDRAFIKQRAGAVSLTVGFKL